jgi:hypothetical protein
VVIYIFNKDQPHIRYMSIEISLGFSIQEGERGLGVVFSVAAVWTGGGEGNRL